MGQTRKVRKGRKAPEESATTLAEGTMKDGWVIKKASNGVPRWVPVLSAELNGFRLYTTDIASKHIGKPIIMYTREYRDMWPKKNAWTRRGDTHEKFKFIPNGDAVKGKAVLEGWLKTQKPAVKKGDYFSVSGPIYEYGSKEELVNGLQVDSVNGKALSMNLLNTEVFVKV